jgi:hypothetical protein
MNGSLANLANGCVKSFPETAWPFINPLIA